MRPGSAGSPGGDDLLGRSTEHLQGRSLVRAPRASCVGSGTHAQGRRAGPSRLALAVTALFAWWTGGCADEGETLAGGSGARASAPDEVPVSRLRFEDRTEAFGLDAFLQTNGDPEKRWITGSIGGGVALFDADADGDLDLYFTNGKSLDPEAPPVRDAFYRNERADPSGSSEPGGESELRFVDRTADVGLGDAEWTNGVRTVDVDGDGWTDLFLTNNGPNRFYRNERGRFVDETEERGLGHPGWGAGAAFLDADRDGDLDLFVANYVALDVAAAHRTRPTQSYRGTEVFFGPRGLPQAVDVFYRQDDAGRFLDVSDEVGIGEHAAFGLGVVVFDHDEDGWIDVYVANDSTPNALWRNARGKRFVERGMAAGLALSVDGTPQAGMGIAVGDVQGDGHPDLYVTNFAEDYNTLYLGEGRGLFRDRTTGADLRRPTMPDLGWATGFHDFDNDGDEDLYVVNGHVFPQVDGLELGTSYRQRNRLLENDRGTLRPVEGGGGFALRQASRGAAVGDLDGDGRLDLVIGNIDGPPAALLNATTGAGNWVGLRLVGPDRNREAVGARLLVESAGRTAMRWVGSAQGFCSSSDAVQHFGLGAATALEGVTVRWPDGTETTHENLAGGRVHVLEASAPR